MSVEHNAKLLGQYERSFKAVFKKDLHRYMHPLWGFDIASFDADLEVPDGISTKDFIKSKYGYPAVAMIKELLS